MPIITVATWFTLARIALTPFFAFALATHHAEAALILFFIAGITDTIDGLIARQFKQKTEFGALLDALADKLLLTIAYILLAFSPGDMPNPIPVWLAVLVILRDLLILTGGWWLHHSRQLGVTHLPPTRWGKWSTAFQMITVAISLVGNALRFTVPFFSLITYSTLVLTLISGLDYLYRALSLIEEKVSG